MMREFFTRLSLLSRFTLVSFSVTFLIVASLAWGLEYTLESDMLNEVAESTAGQASNILDENLTPADLRDSLQGERYEQVDTLIHNTLLSSNIVRIKIWNRNGLLVYSNDQSLVGETFPVSHELEEALKGHPTTEISLLDEDEHASERGLYEKLFEIYVPLQLADSDEILGVYEVYYDLSRLQPRLARIRYLVWGGMGAGFLLLYGMLFLLIRKASLDLIQRNAENQLLLAAEQKQRELSETLERVSSALGEILDLRKLLDLICRESVEVFKTQSAFLWLLEGGEVVGFAAHGPGSDQFIGMRFPIYDPHLLGARVARERKTILVNDAPHSTNVDQTMIERFEIQSMMGIPLIKGKRILGALMIMDSNNPQRFSEEDLKTATVFGSHAALAIDNAQLFERSNLHLEHERALREIDMAITSSPDLNLTLRIVLYQTRKQLNVGAAAILLINQATQTLECISRQGFQTELITQNHIQLGEGRAGNAALERRVFGRAEIESSSQIPDRTELIIAENFCAYFIAPLVTNNKLVGALEIYHHAPLKINTDWLKFLEALAGQAAIAVDNATMFNDLQRSNEELALAYEAAIEGWARALELRDKETEGHTRRVTDMTVKLAREMGIEDRALRHMRQGALLHDIGKMGIPDSILRKPDTLTAEEMKIMRQHPTYAYNLLKGISYLREDLDIPYCHHEKWDGTGYPRGLKGEEIPLSARIFAIADVYDALTSNRPYRKGWGHRTTIEYIRKESGSHFDPQVVVTFLKMMNEEGS
jgi:HD-GYP domain-containing protein (c-di-GMP phosphodiesterase class II)